MKLIIPIAAAALMLTGCSAEVSESSEPAPPPGPTAENVWGFSDYNYVQTVCDRFGNRVYVYEGYKAGGLVVLPRDTSCPQPEYLNHPAIARLRAPGPARQA